MSFTVYWFLCVLVVGARSDPGPDVARLTEDNFDRKVVNSDSIWIVEFYAPWCGHCQAFEPEFGKAATYLKGIVNVGAVNADEQKELAGKYQISGFPTVMIFGADKRKPEKYNGERTAKGVANHAMSVIKSVLSRRTGGSTDSGDSFSGEDAVIELTDSNFDSLVLKSDDIWLVEFFAPWCGHCKRLEPEWKRAASQLKGKVKLGALDATVHQAKASEYGVQGYPTIKYFRPGPKTRSSAEDYTGGRTTSDIVTFALDKVAENVPPPEVKEIIGNEILKSGCDKPLCVIAVLPHILDCQSDCRNNYINIMKTMGEKYKRKLWGWLWAEAGSQPELESTLEIGGFGYPAMAVLNAKKMKYSVLRGSFSEEGVNEFLRDLSYGRGNTSPVRGGQLPTAVETEPWDGKDGVPPADEDVDLSDVELDDIPKDEL